MMHTLVDTLPNQAKPSAASLARSLSAILPTEAVLDDLLILADWVRGEVDSLPD